LDIITQLSISNSYFFNNKINSLSNIGGGSGNPCLNSINALSKIEITLSIFRNNQAFDESNCMNINGMSFYLSDTIFEGMNYISTEPYLGNTGSLTISSDAAFLWNVTFVRNQAFKAAAIFLKNVNGLEQTFDFEEVAFSFYKNHIFLLILAPNYRKFSISNSCDRI